VGLPLPNFPRPKGILAQLFFTAEVLDWRATISVLNQVDDVHVCIHHGLYQACKSSNVSMRCNRLSRT
jgi:hypothetical protein